jgi:lipopolysaccharide export system protein LptA
VLYQIGLASFDQMATPDRDQSFAQKAISSFEYLIANTPPSLFTEKARDKIRVAQRRLADHEFAVAQFYFNQGRYQAVVTRLEGVLGKYPKMPDEDRTLLVLGKSYAGLDQKEKATAALARIVAEYPRSPYSKEAKVALDKMASGKRVAGKPRAQDAKGQGTGPGTDPVAVAKFDDEGRKPLPLLKKEEPGEAKPEEKVTPPMSRESAAPAPSAARKAEQPPVAAPAQEEKAVALPPESRPAAVLPKSSEDRTASEGLQVAIAPQTERPQGLPPLSEPRIEIKPEEEKRTAALPGDGRAKVPERPKKASPLMEPGKGGVSVDKTQPIDITSDRVESFTKDNLIVFTGNVTARQKDMVIYADSIEALIVEDGKGIEKVTADGNVKIQQGIRVASCRKAVFYNLDQKIVLTGEPKVVEGENIVSGEEITFDIEADRVEVKGGSTGRGKARIRPRGETDKKE